MRHVRHSRLVVVSVLSILVSSCLKTRAQLREEGDDRDPGKPIAVRPVQDVQPQGQYVIDEMKAEMTQILGRLEDLERQTKEASASRNSVDKEEFRKLEARLSQLEQAQDSILSEIKKLNESPKFTDPEETFKKAKGRFDEEQYETAAELFGNYLKLPKVKHAEEATFMKAESYYKLKQYKKAIVEYSKFPEKYTRSSKMPDALLKIGQSFEALGMKDDAKGFYQELVEKYPKSPEAKKIRKKVK